jgi:protein phosphatase
MRWSQATDIGWVRPVNEDSLCVCPDLGLFAVADGMGGRQAGEVASRLAIQELEHFLRSCADSQVDTGSVLGEGVQKTNKLVYRMSFKNGECRGMGTTLSCVVIRDNQLCLAHVGDSRIYLLQQGKIIQLTEDHSVVQKMQKEGAITKEEAFHHSYRHVLTRALGVEAEVEVDVARLTLHPKDVILLCTDGLSGCLDEEEMRDIVYNAADLEQAVDLLVHSALTRGGTDNVSVILVAVD